MADYSDQPGQASFEPAIRLKQYLVHSILLLITFFTTAIAGVQWLNKDFLELSNFSSGVSYALLMLLMLGSHEFGHYIAARMNGVSATLPFFLPFPSFFGFFPFGTLGAVIRLRSTVPSRKVLFDIGAAGPIAGFIVSVAILIIGFSTLPPREYLYTIHPEYASMASIPAEGLTFGRTYFYTALARVFASPGAFIPPMNEMYHYPFLCVGWFGMFVTAMNLIPIGQLDGGHIAFAMFGHLHRLIAQVSLAVLAFIGLAGFLPLLGLPFDFGWSGWLFWAILLVVFMRALKLERTGTEDETPLDPARRAIGWTCALILAGSFSLSPFTLPMP